MPSLAFWKSAKADETISEVSKKNDDITVEPVLQVKSLDFDPGSQETGVFVLDDEGNLVLQSPSGKQEQEDNIEPSLEIHIEEGLRGLSSPENQVLEVAPEVKAQTSAPAATKVEVTSSETSSIPQIPEIKKSSHLRSPIPSIVLDSVLSTASNRSSVCLESTSLAKQVSASPTKEPLRRDSEARRLHRPTELNLSNSAQDGGKPKTELEKRFDMMRNSKSHAKATLRSPTALLHDRLNLSPKKIKHTEEHRVFVPPTFSTTGCIMPGPAKKMETFTSASVRAYTEVAGRPAWWCKTDKLVVFDGFDGELKPKTRTSKGLSIARRRGDTETIIIPMDCTHCQNMLNRQEWKYDIQVCKRSVCWDCKERCRWEAEQEMAARVVESTLKAEGNRQRADSVLQDDDMRDEDMMHMIGIEQARPKSPIEVVGGIAERLRG